MSKSFQRNKTKCIKPQELGLKTIKDILREGIKLNELACQSAVHTQQSPTQRQFSKSLYYGGLKRKKQSLGDFNEVKSTVKA